MTEVPLIAALKPVPQRTDAEADFDQIADEFFDDLPRLRTEMNTQATGMNSSRSETDGFKGDAETARDLAQKYANEDEDTEVASGEYSAKHFAAKAEADRIQTGLDRTQTGTDVTTSQAAAAAAQAGAGLPALTGNAGKALVVNEEEDGVEYQTIAGNTQIFTASGTWTKPLNVTYARVIAIGGGTGGSSGRTGATSTNDRDGGAGGGGGAGRDETFLVADLGDTETVGIGAGGLGGEAVTTSNTAQNIGAVGGDTTFGAHLKAYGGVNGGANAHVVGQIMTFTGASAASNTSPAPLNGAAGGIGDSIGGSAAGGKHASGAGAGGGGGGAVSFGSIAFGGGDGGWKSVDMTGPSGGAAQADGVDGVEVGEAGSGGGANNSGNGGKGGDGGPGAGGGGGGGALNGNNSGAGGDGGDGYCIVICW